MGLKVLRNKYEVYFLNAKNIFKLIIKRKQREESMKLILKKRTQAIKLYQ